MVFLIQPLLGLRASCQVFFAAFSLRPSTLHMISMSGLRSLFPKAVTRLLTDSISHTRSALTYLLLTPRASETVDIKRLKRFNVAQWCTEIPRKGILFMQPKHEHEGWGREELNKSTSVNQQKSAGQMASQKTHYTEKFMVTTPDHHPEPPCLTVGMRCLCCDWFLTDMVLFIMTKQLHAGLVPPKDIIPDIRVIERLKI